MGHEPASVFHVEHRRALMFGANRKVVSAAVLASRRITRRRRIARRARKAPDRPLWIARQSMVAALRAQRISLPERCAARRQRLLDRANRIESGTL